MGDRSIVGWWYYMPIALALKSTPSELVIMAYGVWACVTGWRRVSSRTLVWRVALITFADPGHREPSGARGSLRVAGPSAPSLDRVRALDRRTAGRPRWSWAAGLALVVAQAVSAATIAPHYLSYFNRLTGGPETGYLYLADSNIDWGQDLPALRETLARVGAKRPLVSYFGNAPFDQYGVSADVWDSDVRPISRDGTGWPCRSRTLTACTCRTTSFGRSAPSRRRREPDTRYSCMRRVDPKYAPRWPTWPHDGPRRVSNEACH